MKAAQTTLLLVLLLAWILPLAAEEPYMVKTYASFAALKADTAKSCELISHDCEICTVTAEKTLCSSVGAGCVPKEWRCYEKPAAPR